MLDALGRQNHNIAASGRNMYISGTRISDDCWFGLVEKGFAKLLKSEEYYTPNRAFKVTFAGMQAMCRAGVNIPAERMVQEYELQTRLEGSHASYMNHAKIAYQAYCDHAGGRSLITGKLLPTWENVKPEVKVGWLKAAMAVLFPNHKPAAKQEIPSVQSTNAPKEGRNVMGLRLLTALVAAQFVTPAPQADTVGIPGEVHFGMDMDQNKDTCRTVFGLTKQNAACFGRAMFEQTDITLQLEGGGTVSVKTGVNDPGRGVYGNTTIEVKPCIGVVIRRVYDNSMDGELMTFARQIIKLGTAK